MNDIWASLDAELVARKIEMFDSPRYSDPSYPGYPGNPLELEKDYRDPSRYWAEKLGIPELTNSYEAVLAADHAEIQCHLLKVRGEPGTTSEAVYPLIYDLHGRLCEKYPELSGIEIITDMDVWHVVMGCVSKFNFDDISYFVSLRSQHKTYEEASRNLRIFEKLGYYMEWRLSPETMSILEQHIGLCDDSKPGMATRRNSSGKSDRRNLRL